MYIDDQKTCPHRVFHQLFCTSRFYNFPALPIHGLYRKYIFCRKYFFFLKSFGTWLPVAMFVAGVHGSKSLCMHAYALAYWYAWCVWTLHVHFLLRIYSVLFVQIFNTCALVPKCPCLWSYYGFGAIFIIVEGPLDICSLVAYLVVHYLTRSCCNCACFLWLAH